MVVHNQWGTSPPKLQSKLTNEPWGPWGRVRMVVNRWTLKLRSFVFWGISPTRSFVQHLHLQGVVPNVVKFLPHGTPNVEGNDGMIKMGDSQPWVLKAFLDV